MLKRPISQVILTFAALKFITEHGSDQLLLQRAQGISKRKAKPMVLDLHMHTGTALYHTASLFEMGHISEGKV